MSDCGDCDCGDCCGDGGCDCDDCCNDCCDCNDCCEDCCENCCDVSCNWCCCIVRDTSRGGISSVPVPINVSKGVKNKIVTSQPTAEPIFRQSIVLAINATRQRAGGVLVLPRTSQVQFYSVDWASHFQLPDKSDEYFQMLNAKLALDVFEQLVLNYRKLFPEDEFVCKCSNQFISGQSSSNSNVFGTQVISKLEGFPFRGKWEIARMDEGDISSMIADKLSSQDYSSVAYLDDVPNNPYNSYNHYNVSQQTQNELQNLAKVYEELSK